ncbi:LPD38 domain-containing protein [Pseudomonas aeruginosa]|nr:hypothetical protein [Pseudomonas aeruginosa]HCF5789871.1 hypothetical protein [Pseudomonas aeruginosa]
MPFDPKTAQPLSTSFDPSSATEEKSSTFRRVVGDTGISLLKGAIGVPEAAVGIADIVTGGQAGKAAEGLGFRPKEAKQILDDLYTPEQKAANQRVAQAEGFVDTAQAMLANPSTIAHTVAESAPSMLAGGAVGRGVGALTKLPAWALGAVGEGAIGAGQAAESIRQSTDDGLLSAKQSGAALLSGLGTGALAGLGGKAAQKLGISDVDTLLAGGAAQASSKSLPRRVVEGALTEGALQELPQSMQEQAWQNFALDQPLGQGVAEAGAAGLLAGGVMGAGGGVIHARPHSEAAPEAAASSGPLSRAVGQLPAPNIAGALPAPEQTVFVDAAGNANTQGPVRNVDGEMRPEPQARQPWVDPGNGQAFGGPGMEQQVPPGQTPLVGEYQPAAAAPVDQPPAAIRTFEGEVVRPSIADLRQDAFIVDSQGQAEPGATRNQFAYQGPAPRDFGPGMEQSVPRGTEAAPPNQPAAGPARAALPAPDTFVVDGQGNAARGPVAPFVAPEPQQVLPGGPGMDQQAQSVQRPSLDLLLPQVRKRLAAGEAIDAAALAEQTGASRALARQAVQGAQLEQKVVSQVFKSVPGANKALRSLPLADQFEVAKTGTRQWQVRAKTAQEVGNADSPAGVADDGTRGTAVAAPTQVPEVAEVPAAQPGRAAVPGGQPDSGAGVPAAAPAADGQPAVAPAVPRAKGARRNVDRDRDSVVQAAIRLGGLKTEWRQDTTGEAKGNKQVPGVGALWSDKTGTSLDDMASLLDQHGYVPAGEMERDGGVNWLQGALREELAGQRTHFAPDSARQHLQLEQEEHDRRADEAQRAKDQREDEYARIEAEHGPDVAAQVRAYDEALEATRDQLLEESQRYDEQLAEQDREDLRAAIESASPSAGDEHLREGPGKPGGKPAATEREQGFSLEQQTEQSLKEQDARQAAAAREQARADQESERRAQADSERAGFTLTGSDRPTDIGAAQGQQDLLSTNRYSRQSYRQDRVTAGIKADTLRRVVAQRIAGWRNAPQVHVVQSIADLPGRLRQQVKRDGAVDVEGIMDGGGVYLIAENLGSFQHAAFVLAHEVMGHSGLQGAFGARLNPTLNSIYQGNARVRAEADRLAARFGYDRTVAVEEVLADMAAAGNLQQQSFWGRLVTAMRSALRSIGLGLKWSETDIRGLLADARRYIENGSPRSARQRRYSRKPESREFADTERVYGGMPAYERAKAAGRTELSYDDWIRVRTPSFIEANGDWLALRAQTRLDEKPAVKLTTPPAWAGHSGKKVVSDVMDALKQMVRQDEVLRHDELGEIRVGSAGVKKATSNSADPAKRVVLNQLREAFEHSIYASSSRDVKGEGQMAYHKLLAPIEVDGVPLVAVFTVREDSNGAFFYNAVTLDRNEKAPAASPADMSKTTQRSFPANTGAASFVRQAIERVNPASVTVPINPTTGEPLVEGAVRYSRASQREALRKLGLAPKEAQKLSDKIEDLLQRDWKALLKDLGRRSEEGLADGLIGIRRAEEAVGVIDPNRQGYVSARLASGLADVMHGVLHYGAPEWRDGVVARKADTRGLLEVLGDLGAGNLNDWLGWLGGKRAEQLKAQGRENNLSDQEIADLVALAKGREQLFERAYRDYAKLNDAVLDLAEGAGLIDPDARKAWANDYYVPFYRETEDSLFSGPRTKRGLSHQTAAIKALKGGEIPTSDLLENILTGWSRRVDASLKNKALLEVVDNLKGSPFLSDESVRYTQAIIPRAELAKRVRKDRKTQQAVAAMLGLKDGVNAMKVASELLKPENEGFEKLWALTAPSDPDIIRVQRGGKNEYYKVNDESLLRGLKSMAGSVFNDPITRIGRAFKRVLTTGVTASPDFILRNFIRDAAHAWVINKDGFKLGRDSIKGLRDAFRQDQEYRNLMFAGASFQGGYVHGTDPEASAQIIRRALAKKGLNRARQDSYLSSLVTSPKQLADILGKGWEHYREVGERVENANRLSTYKAALEAGKSPRQAAFEAKDLMDYSLRGNFAALQWFTDMVPFLNARIQGLYKLGRAAKGDTSLIAKQVAMKGGYLMLFTLALAALNGDDERYKELQEFDKDTNWHIFLGDQHFRIPKPFELGLIFGTVPERLLHLATGNENGKQFGGAIARGIFDTLAFNPVPQFYQPIRELQANRNFFMGTPIEDMADEGKLPEARYDERTSALAKAAGQLTGPALGISPKQLDHLVKGYTGTMGAYVLAMGDLVAAAMTKGEMPTARVGDLPIAKVLYRGDEPRSTRHQAEFYDMMQEADQLYRTMRYYRQEGRVDAAEQLLEANRAKLRHRPALGLARQQLGALRKQMDAVYRNTEMTGDQKRERLNELQLRSNQVAERVVKASQADF